MTANLLLSSVSHMIAFSNDAFSQRRYLNSDRPRLIIRAEDLILHTEKLFELIHDCVGLERPNKQHVYHHHALQTWGKPSTFYTTLQKYGSDVSLWSSLLDADVEYARKALDPALLRLLNYAPVPSLEEIQQWKAAK